MKRVGIFYFSHISHNFLKQRPQQLYLNWKNNLESPFEFYYMEISIIGFFNNILNKFKGRQEDPNILIIPFFRFFNDKLILKNIVSVYNRFILSVFLKYKKLDGMKKIIIVSTPHWEPMVYKNKFDIICYDYLDSIDLFTMIDNKNNTLLMHKNLVSKSDIVFVTAEKLKEDIKLLDPSKKIITVSNGVDPDYFQNNNSNKIEDYHKNTKKVIGYVGALSEWIDFEIIYKSAEAINDVDFVLIGPISDHNKKYINKKPDNVFLLGKKPYEQIPSYIKIFDVAIIPFKKGDIAESTDPIKVYEYFSLGKPVVSTYLKQLTKFENGNLLKIAITENEFIEALKFYLNNDKYEWQKERKKVAEDNSWSKKANLIIKSINDIIKVSNGENK